MSAAASCFAGRARKRTGLRGSLPHFHAPSLKTGFVESNSDRTKVRRIELHTRSDRVNIAQDVFAQEHPTYDLREIRVSQVWLKGRQKRQIGPALDPPAKRPSDQSCGPFQVRGKIQRLNAASDVIFQRDLNGISFLFGAGGREQYFVADRGRDSEALRARATRRPSAPETNRLREGIVPRARVPRF